jgi:ankyrin repeat protein
MEAVSSIKFDLSLMYRQMLDRIGARGRKLLHWMLYAVEELTVEELRFAVGIEPGMKDLDCELDLPPSQSFLDSALGLLSVAQGWHNRQLVRFSHFTIKDYLSHHSSQYFPDGHILLAQISLTYLNFTALSTESGRARFGEQGDLYPFFKYAAFEWGHHAREADNDAKTCDIVLEWLLSERFSQVLDVRSRRFVGHHWVLPLHETCLFGLHSTTVKLLESETNVNVLDSEQRTPLHYAAQHGHSGLVQTLLQNQSINVNASDSRGGTPLHYASSGGHTDTVKVLLRHQSIQINLRDKDGRSPLHLAIREGQEAIVHLLQDRPDIDVNVPDLIQRTPLHLATYFGQTQIAQALLQQRSIQINLQDEDGSTALHLAVKEKCEAIVQLLLRHPDINVNVLDRFRRTPLHLAAYRGQTQIAHALLHHRSIQINLQDERGRTPLHLVAIARQETVQVVHLLLERQDINVNMPDWRQRTPLHLAVYWNCTQITCALLHSPDINVNHRDVNGSTPLMYAIDRNSLDIARILLEHEATDIYPACILAEGRQDQLPSDILLKLGVLLLSDLEIALFSKSLY